MINEKMRLQLRMTVIQENATGKVKYEANELAVINSSSMLAKYKEYTGKFKNVLDEVYKCEIELNSFWENANLLIDQLEGFNEFSDSVNPNYSPSSSDLDSKLIEEIVKVFQYLSARDLGILYNKNSNDKKGDGSFGNKNYNYKNNAKRIAGSS